MDSRGRKKRKGIFAIICLTAIIAGVVFFIFSRAERYSINSFASFTPRSAQTIAFFEGLGAGWNLGNTLDAHNGSFTSDTVSDYAGLWGNPQPDARLFKALYAAGFRTVRIPVTWYPHMDGQHWVNGAWMDYVRQTVDYALDAGLYVIVNAHHDNWYSPFAENIDRAVEMLAVLWEQISSHFAEYDERLIFEGMNEPRLVGNAEEWTAGTPGARQGVDRLNQVFVDTVRASGGKNAGRYLLVTTYAAIILPEALEGFTVPEDDRTALSLHIYQPLDFALIPDGTDKWSPADDNDLLGQVFGSLYKAVVSRGLPVVMTEYGTLDKNNTETRVAWARYVREKAAEARIPCIWWDNGIARGNSPKGTFALLNRVSLEWYFPEIVDAITERK
ncbi:MAG: Endoglucanase 1 [Desulfovibrio sp.]